ncbi:MAG TPA: hypothetical protein VJX66_23850 [Amycolatopsis sp.]|nr:hypothetical protein [Amycolatopsis sp.]
MPGGSIGVSGPRGAGKTTLLQHFCSPEYAARDKAPAAPIRVLLSAPVRYDPREFVLHLFASVCHGVVGPDELRIEIDTSWFRRRLVFQAVYVVASLCAAWGAFLVVAAVAGWKLNPNLQSGVYLLVAAGTALVLATAWRQSLRFRGDLRFPDDSDALGASARALLTGLAYQQSIGHGWSAGVKLPAGVEVGTSSSTTMTEKPMGFPEIVSRFREFLRQASASRRIYIGIDELDKFDSSADIYAFLNDIKSIFGIPGCYYLISISENAMSAFERRGLPLRDAFDSAFDAVVDIPCLDFTQSRRLLRRRVIGMPEQFVALAHVMSGGLPRDLIRVARDLVALLRVSEAFGRDAGLRRRTARAAHVAGVRAPTPDRSASGPAPAGRRPPPVRPGRSAGVGRRSPPVRRPLPPPPDRTAEPAPASLPRGSALPGLRKAQGSVAHHAPMLWPASNRSTRLAGRSVTRGEPTC